MAPKGLPGGFSSYTKHHHPKPELPAAWILPVLPGSLSPNNYHISATHNGEPTRGMAAYQASQVASPHTLTTLIKLINNNIK